VDDGMKPYTVSWYVEEIPGCREQKHETFPARDGDDAIRCAMGYLRVRYGWDLTEHEKDIGGLPVGTSPPPPTPYIPDNATPEPAPEEGGQDG